MRKSNHFSLLLKRFQKECLVIFFGVFLVHPLSVLASIDCQPGVDFKITSEVPHDVNPDSARLQHSKKCQQELAFFAWQQFLALSWQSNYSEGTPFRGQPDTQWSYKKPYAKGQPLVWETYAHRSELRPAGQPLNTPFNKPPKYIYVNQPLPGETGASFALFNNLDEDNEIGSCDVYLGSGDPKTQDLILYQAKVNQAEYDYIKDNFGAGQADPAGPLAKAAQANIKSIQQYKQASPKGIDLPAGFAGGSEGAIEIKTAFLRVTPVNASLLEDFYQTEAIYYTADYNAASDSYTDFRYHNGTFALLAMHVIHKTKAYPDFIFTSFEHKGLANLNIKQSIIEQDLLKAEADLAVAVDDWEKAQRALAEAKSTSNPIKRLAEYIEYEYQTAQAVMALKEAVSQLKAAKKAGIAGALQYRLVTPLPPSYGNFNPFNAPAKPGKPTGTQTGQRHKIVRQTGSSPKSNGQLYPVPPYLDQVTAKVHKKLRGMNKDSVWLNYRLIGVQANITEGWSAAPQAATKTSTAKGPNHFMANFVIESDAFLGNFFGPGFGTNPFPSGKGNGDNVVYGGESFNMGGCKGCHGVAQTAFGTDFSFLLDYGVDKPVVNPDTIHYHADEP